MTLLPIVERELRVAARRPITHWVRLGFALAGAGIVGLALLFAAVAQAGASRIGAGLFYFLSILALGFSALAGVFLTADCLSEEKREGTLGLLFLTDLKSYDVVFGKLIGRSLSAVYGLLAVFPVLAITLTMGGVSAGEFWRMALVLLNTIFFSLAAGMFVSSLGGTDHRSMAGAAGLILFVGGGLPLMEWMLNQAGFRGRFTISLPSPLTAWQLAFDAPFRMWGRSFGDSLLLAQASSWLFLGLACLLLPNLLQSDGGLFSLARGKPAIAPHSGSLGGGARRAPALDRNPVYWLVIRNSRMPWAVWFIWAALAVGFAWFFYRQPTAALAVGQNGWLLLLVVLRILVGVYACRFFAEARRIGALELLLATPLTVDQILRGQWMALRRLFLVPSIALLGAGILPLFLIFLTDLPNAFPTWIILGSAYAFSIPKLICDLLAAAWTGMLVGLTAKKPNLAPGLTVLYTVVLPVAAFCVPDVFISLPLFLWARDKLYRELRILSSVSYRPVAPLYAPAPPAAKPPLVLHS